MYRKLAAGDSSRTGVKATTNVSIPNTDTPQANNSLHYNVYIVLLLGSISVIN